MPAKPTSAQSAASRLNGAHSQGPASEAGKAASARNAMRHGLRAGGAPVLDDDECRWLDELTREHSAIFRPAGPTEQAIVEAMALCEIKRARLDRLELEALAAAGDPEADPRLLRLTTLTRYAATLMRERAGLERRLAELQERRRLADPAVRARSAATLARLLGRDEPPIAQSNPSPAEPAPEPPLNRHERRRQQTLARRLPTAA